MNYFDVWTGDYLKKTLHLDTVEHGAYFMLMLAYYSDEKPLPSDRKILYRICKARSKSHKQAVDKIVEEFFYLGEDGKLHNTKCDSQIEKYFERSTQNSERGKKSAETRKLIKMNGGIQSNDSSTSHEIQLPNPQSPIPNPSLLNIHKADGFLTDTERATILLEEIRIKLPDAPKVVTRFEERSLRGLIAQHGYPKVEEAINKCGLKKWHGTPEQITDFILGKVKEKDYSKAKNGYSPPETNTNLPAYKPYVDKTRDVKREPMPQDIRTLLQGIQQ